MPADSDCTFCRIARGELEADIVVESESFLAFLDDRPVFPGHTLLIPREHYETLADLPASLGAEFLALAQTLSQVVPAAVDAEGTFVAINNKVSQSVPHLHLHVVPRRRKDGLRGFFWPRSGYRDDEQKLEIAAAIRKAFRALGSQPGPRPPIAGLPPLRSDSSSRNRCDRTSP